MSFLIFLFDTDYNIEYIYIYIYIYTFVYLYISFQCIYVCTGGEDFRDKRVKVLQLG